MNKWIALSLLVASLPLHAETPLQVQQAYSAQANAANGEALFKKKNSVNDKMPACTSCHTDNPMNSGQHAITGKTIRPMAVKANPERFTDPAKVEKWFGRNCKEVLGRACSSQEKADVIKYMSEVR